MSILAVCRVCLTDDVRLHVIVNTPLQEIFEKLINISLTQEDGKPLLICYICRSYLRKCQTLIEKAVKAELLLNQLLQNGVLLTQTPITLPDRQVYNLTGGLSISPTVHITAIDEKLGSVVNDACAIKDEVPIKFEEQVPEQKIENDSDTNHHSDHHSQSDSDDNIPLKSISLKKQLDRRATKRVGIRKRGERRVRRAETGFTADFAREIILSKQQQLQELSQRASSLNYLNSPLKCTLCYRGFVDTRAYHNHRERHDEKSGSYECEICHMRYRTARQLRTHSATSHGRQYACNKCDHRSHTANQAREHEKWHSGYTYECKLCGQKFRKPTSYLTHMRKRHPTQHVCNLCGESFVGRHGLLMHKSKTHQRDEKRADTSSEPASKRFCGECNIQFASLDAWTRHILSSVKHTLANGNSPQCRICDALLPSNAALTTHLRSHSRALQTSRTRVASTEVLAELACEQCGAHFVNRSKLQAHVKRIHLGLKYNKNIVCEVCGKKCTSNASLKYHQRTHTGEKPYQCNTCSKRFSDNNQLRIHTRTHTGERPYCCAACGKRFSQKPALNRHYRVHTGAKPYTCQFCSKTFSQSNSLKLHVRTVHLKLPPNNRRNKVQSASQDVVIEDVEKEDITLQNL